MQPVTTAPPAPAHLERKCEGYTRRSSRRSNRSHLTRVGRRLILGALAAMLLLGALLAGAPVAQAQTTTCTVLVPTLNLRSGPGTTYSVVTKLAQGTKLKQLARTASGWLNVETQTTPKRTGYVSGAAAYVSCTTAPTAPSAPQPPVARTRRVISPPGGGGDVQGYISVDPAEVDADFIRYDDDDNQIAFERNMWLRAEIDDDSDIGGVDHVVFAVSPNDYFDDTLDEFGQAYTRRENTDGYCIFGGGEPDCTPLRLRAGVTWPGTESPIYNGSYTLSVSFYDDPDDGFGDADSSWFINLIIDSPELDGPPGSEGSTGEELPPPDLQVLLVETMPGSQDSYIFGALNFRVAAWDPAVGDDDGDGIDGVNLEIFGPSGLVHERREGTDGYCAFGGGEPDCTSFVFADGGWAWPESGMPVESGFHTLRATVFADDGRTLEATWSVEIE